MPDLTASVDAALGAQLHDWASRVEREAALWTLSADPEFEGQTLASTSMELPGGRKLHITRYNVAAQNFDPSSPAAFDGGPLMFACLEEVGPDGVARLMEEESPEGLTLSEASLDTAATVSQVVAASLAKWGALLQTAPAWAAPTSAPASTPIPPVAPPDLTIHNPLGSLDTPDSQTPANGPELPLPGEYRPEIEHPEQDPATLEQDSDVGPEIRHVPPAVTNIRPPLERAPLHAEALSDSSVEDSVDPLSQAPALPEGVAPTVTPALGELMQQETVASIASVEPIEARSLPAAELLESSPVVPTPSTPTPVFPLEFIPTPPKAAPLATWQPADSPPIRSGRSTLMAAAAIATLTAAAPVAMLGVGVAAVAWKANGLRQQQLGAQEAPFTVRFGYVLGRAVGMVRQAADQEMQSAQRAVEAHARALQDRAREVAERATQAIVQPALAVRDRALDLRQSASQHLHQGAHRLDQTARQGLHQVAQHTRHVGLQARFVGAMSLDAIERAQSATKTRLSEQGERLNNVGINLRARVRIAALQLRAKSHALQLIARNGADRVSQAIAYAFAEPTGDQTNLVSAWRPAAGMGMAMGMGAIPFTMLPLMDAEQGPRALFSPDTSSPSAPTGPAPTVQRVEPVFGTASPATEAPTQPPLQSSLAEQAMHGLTQRLAQTPSSKSPAPQVSAAPLETELTTAVPTAAQQEQLDRSTALCKKLAHVSSGGSFGETEFNALRELCAQGVFPTHLPALPLLQHLTQSPYAQSAIVLLSSSSQANALLGELRTRTLTEATHNCAEFSDRLRDFERLIAVNSMGDGPALHLAHDASKADSNPLLLLARSMQEAGGAPALDASTLERSNRVLDQLLLQGVNAQQSGHFHALAAAGWADGIATLAKAGALPFANAAGESVDHAARGLDPASRTAVLTALDEARGLAQSGFEGFALRAQALRGQSTPVGPSSRPSLS